MDFKAKWVKELIFFEGLMWEFDIPAGSKPIGYRYLFEYFQLKVINQHRWSYVTPHWESKEFKYERSFIELRLYPKSYEIDPDPIKHMEFAL